MTTAVVLSNTYHPGNRGGFTPSAEMVSYRISEDMGSMFRANFGQRLPGNSAAPATNTSRQGTTEGSLSLTIDGACSPNLMY
jgi:hypothetical protein